MKILLTFAVTLAAFAPVSARAENVRGSGHWEWQNRSQPGPNKSNLPSRVRVWAKDDQASMVNCDCDMMMPVKGATPANG